MHILVFVLNGLLIMFCMDYLSKKIVGLLFILLLTACSGGSSSDSEQVLNVNEDQPREETSIPDNNLTVNPQGDISHTTLTNRNPDCGAYVGQYSSTILDAQQSISFDSQLTITATVNSCIFSSNNIPNHDVGANTTTGNNFASQISPNQLSYVLTVKRNPIKTNNAIYVRKVASSITLNGIMLNGVDLDMDSAFCYNTDFTTPLQISLGTREQCGLFADWYAVPAANPDYVTLDEYTGHPFDGRYHYHGDNHGLSNVEENNDVPSASLPLDASGSPVIGFAPDGFPIYGHYFYDTTTQGLRKAQSSWQTLTVEREAPVGSTDPVPSITTHERGVFVADWQYVAASGDLDECNGMVDAYGNYGYYYTETYPYGPLCSFAIPDPSFIKSNTEYNAN
jgi:YHYH protein